MTNERKPKTPYFTVPVDVFEQGLSPYELAVYAYLCRCADRENTAFPAVPTMAKKCGVSLSTARRALHGLEEKGLVTAKARYLTTADGQSRRSSNHYVIGETGDDANDRQGKGAPVCETGGSCQSDRGAVSVGKGGGVSVTGDITNSNRTNSNVNNFTVTNSISKDGCAEAEEEKAKKFEKSSGACAKKSPPPFLEQQLHSDAFMANYDGATADLCRRAAARLWNVPSLTVDGVTYDNEAVRAAFDPPPPFGCLYTAVECYRAARQVQNPVAYLATCYFRAVVNGEDGWTEKDEYASSFWMAAVRKSYGGWPPPKTDNAEPCAEDEK